MKTYNNELEIYIHIPFCIKKCKYCDFLSGSFSDSIKERYVDKLCSEIASFDLNVEKKVTTVFFGGGTPSVLNERQFEKITEALRKRFSKIEADKELEFTVECNPGTVNLRKLKLYRELSVNRLSLGLQSTLDTELEELGRIHRYSDFLRSYEQAREAGFKNINVDLMFAIPNQTREAFLKSLKTITKLGPEHISVYSLILEEGTEFYSLYNKSDEGIFLSEEDERSLYHETGKYLSEQGYPQYEISNYARQGFECRHNTGYWQGRDYIGFGLGAASMLNNQRFSKTKSLSEYLEGKNEYSLRRETVELSVNDRMEEFVFLGLRMNRGISAAEFKYRFMVEIDEVYGKILSKHINLKTLQRSNDHICLTEYGRDVSNTVFTDFLQ